ncbi:MAG: hypothetical protein LBS40_01215 [Burkholderiales bacterium]|jgi:hypothetical protein|nr:hypothetical protein [Burkholderiales bacterium]
MDFIQVKRMLFLFLLACFVAACGGRSANMPADDSQPEQAKNMLEARLIGKGGAGVRGTVTISAKGKYWLVSSTIGGAMPGDYLIAFYDNGNCTSPNAFSAGKIWLPPDTPEGTKADAWIPPLSPNPSTGSAQIVVRLPNPAEHGIAVFHHRSVLVFSGRKAEELKPDVRNDVVACGVFEAPVSLLDPLGPVF